MGREARAARREAGSEERAANGREGAWRCREEEAGGGRGPGGSASSHAPGGTCWAGTGEACGKTGKGTVWRRSSP